MKIGIVGRLSYNIVVFMSLIREDREREVRGEIVEEYLGNNYDYLNCMWFFWKN